jgi:hypothetical protein
MSAYDRLRDSNRRILEQYTQQYIQAASTHFDNPNVPKDKEFFIVKFYHYDNVAINSLAKHVEMNMLGEICYMGSEDEDYSFQGNYDENEDSTVFYTLYMRPYEQNMENFANTIHFLFGSSFGYEIMTEKEYEKTKKGVA